MPWARIQPYLVGLFLGYILHRLDGKPLGVSRPTAVWAWAVAGALGAVVVYGPYDIVVKRPLEGGEASLAESVAYTAFSKLAWSLAVSWLILACVKGLGGPINRSFSSRPLSPFLVAFSPLINQLYTRGPCLIHLIQEQPH